MYGSDGSQYKIGPYVICFWPDEGKPLEPIHVYIAEGIPGANATKVWLIQSWKAILSNNRPDIQAVELRKLIRVIEANTDEIREKWLEYFDEIRYCC